MIIGLNPTGINLGADVNEDGKIGLAEVIRGYLYLTRCCRDEIGLERKRMMRLKKFEIHRNIGGMMEAFEFEAIHKNGMIKIPDELRKNLTKKIKIIILTEEKKKNALSKLLLNAPTWDESDVMDFQQTIREGYKNWKIEEF